MSQTQQSDTTNVSTLVENGFVSNVSVSPWYGNSYNHLITLLDQSGDKVGDFYIDNLCSAIDNMLHALLVACASGLQVTVLKNDDSGKILSVSMKGIKG